MSSKLVVVSADKRQGPRPYQRPFDFPSFSFSQVRRHSCPCASLRFFEQSRSFHPSHRFFRLPHLITLHYLGHTSRLSAISEILDNQTLSSTSIWSVLEYSGYQERTSSPHLTHTDRSSGGPWEKNWPRIAMKLESYSQNLIEQNTRPPPSVVGRNLDAADCRLCGHKFNSSGVIDTKTNGRYQSEPTTNLHEAQVAPPSKPAKPSRRKSSVHPKS